MKVHSQDYAELRAAIDAVRAKFGEAQLIAYKAKLTGAYVKDVDKRFRWDLFWAIPQDVRNPLMDRFYSYCDDSHLDTALRSIVKGNK